MSASPNRLPLLWLAALAAFAVLLHGYHLGVEDQTVYLPAIKKHLDPGLYPHDADFFLLQTQLGLFVDGVAWTARVSRVPLDWVIFTWHFVSIFLLLLGCWLLSRRCFTEARAQWASIGAVVVLLTLPIAGTALLLVDQYLHPRLLATACLLFALDALLDRRPRTLVWVLLAGLMHPTMTLYGLWHLAVQAFRPRGGRSGPSGVHAACLLALALPQLWVRLWPPPTSAWREALATRDYLFPQHWAWYELLGALAPLVILFWFSRLARKITSPTLEAICVRLAISGAIGVTVGMVIGLTPSLVQLIPLEPMRTLHLIYLFLILFAGGLFGQYVLHGQIWRWLIFLPIAGGMFAAQRAEFSSSPHIEWPGRIPQNAWVEAFDWVRRSTPRDALFAMDPGFLEGPGEDQHGFRAFAERSQLAEEAKDRAVSRNIPGLAYGWRQQVRDQQGIGRFGPEQFAGLRRKYGVGWVVLSTAAQGGMGGAAGLSCPFSNRAVRVCRIP